ncbi:MAG: sulfatase-like hydrolase/transferase [Ferruginibacter sp.]
MSLERNDKITFTAALLSAIKFLFFYWMIWVIFFEIARLVFLFTNYSEWEQAGTMEGLRSLLYGLRMDMSMAAYLAIPVILFILISYPFPFFRRAVLYKIYTSILLILIVLVLISDIGLYKAWGSRIDASPLKYFSNPKEMWASVSNLPIFWILFGYVIVVWILVKLFIRFIQWGVSHLKQERFKWLQVASLLLIGGLFIIPMRGGFQLAPINQSTVYFSQSNFANLATLNAPWNFMYSINHNVESGVNPFVFFKNDLSEKIKDSLFISQRKTESVISKKTSGHPNVILIIWESFTSKVIDSVFERKEITPGFNRLKNEGTYFSNIYASGDRTDKGIVAVLSGYPSQPTTSIVKVPSKAAKLPSLGKLLKDDGYHTAFYYGGELEFANIKAYLLQAGYQQFISIDDFDKKDRNSKWGAHDGVVEKRLQSNINKMQQPFFVSWLTLSSHEPFETPMAPYFHGKDDKSLFLNSLHYTDSCVSAFITFAKSQPWWSNTIIMVVADHGHRIPRSDRKENDFKIPILMTGGAISKNETVRNVGGQTDLPATLWGQLKHGKPNPFPWSKDLLDSSTLHWAYFSFNNGFGFVSDSSMFIHDNVGNRMIESRGRVDSFQARRGKAFLQSSFQDYLDK